MAAIRPGTARPPAGDVPAWIGSFGVDRPGVYITAGTERAAPDAPWAAFAQAVASLDVDAVATLGSHVDPAQLGEQLRDRIEDALRRGVEGGAGQRGTTEVAEVHGVADEHAPIRRFGTVEELADFMVFLCSPRASYAVGSTYFYDGGMLRTT